MNYIGTQKLLTKRLILRRIEINDYKEAYKNIYSNKKISKNTLWEIHKYDVITKQLFKEYEKEYNNPNIYRWIIELKDNNEIIGIIDNQYNKYEEYNVIELGFCLSEKYWNNGFMTEALKRVIEFFMEEVKVNVIYSECLSNNISCIKLLEKINMKQEGILRNRVIINNKKIDLLSYSIIKEDYRRE